MGKHDKDIIHIKCSRCGTPIEIKWATYRKSKTHEHLCRKCRGEDRHNEWESKSEEEKEIFHTWRSKLTSDGYKNMSKEDYDKMIESRKKSWTDDRKKKQSEFAKNLWENRSQEEKDRIIKLSNIGKELYWTDEMKIIKGIEARKRWFNQPKEKQNEILENLHNAYAKYYASLSDDERIKQASIKSDQMKKWWANLSDEERERHMNNIRKGLKMNFDLLNIDPNKNEKAFIDFMNSNFIPIEFIHYNQIKHPDFDKLFPINPYHGSNVCPYHAWDFIVYTEKPVLVDIDGSIHCKEKSSNIVHFMDKEFILYDYIAFKESQRPYQTDGLDAYVVQCYDDNLTLDTPVVNISTNEKILLKEFIIKIKSNLKLNDYP